MQRFLRELPAANVASPLIASYPRKVETIRRFFPPSVAAVYAVPREGTDGGLEWWTAEQGEVRAFSTLDADKQRALLDAYADQQIALTQLAEALDQRGLQSEAVLVRSLIGPAIPEHLYSIEGRPLVTRWGTPLPTTIATPDEPAFVAAPEAPISHSNDKKRVLWLWLLAALILAGLCALLWWRWASDRTEAKLPVPVVAAPKVCSDDEDSQSLSIDATPTALAPEFVVVLDTSNSMRLNIKTPHAAESAAIQLMFKKFYLVEKAEIPELERWLEPPSRATIAKEALSSLVKTLPDGVQTQFITFSGRVCQAPIHHGTFARHDRDRLLDVIASSKMAGGTPLAQTLEVAAASVDGKNRDAVVLMFVDGEDGCKRDICSVAAQIAQEKPRLKVNLVDISGAGLSRCVAQATNGRVFTSQDAGEIRRMLEQASETVAKPTRHCKA